MIGNHEKNAVQIGINLIPVLSLRLLMCSFIIT